MCHREGEECARRLQLAALPGKYKVTGFMDGYSEYYNEVTKHETFFGNAGNWIILLGGLIFVSGIYSVFFGSSNFHLRSGSLTPIKFMLAYPILINIVGVLVMGFGNWVRAQLAMTYMAAESYLLYKWRLILPDGTERDEKLAIRWLEGEFFEIGLKPDAD